MARLQSAIENRPYFGLNEIVFTLFSAPCSHIYKDSSFPLSFPSQVKQFSVALIEEMKFKRYGYPGDEFRKQLKLPQPFTREDFPAEPLMQGWLKKLGGKRKTTWQDRYFIASNMYHDYQLYYYKEEVETLEPEKAQKCKSLRGYHVARCLSTEAKKAYGELSVELIPTSHSELRKTYRIAAKDEETMDQWEGIFKTLAAFGKPPLNPDPVLRKAFERAFEKTILTFYSWYRWSTLLTEGELLADLMKRRVMQGPMNGYTDKIHGKFCEKKKETVDSILNKTIELTVGGGWKATQESVQSARKTIEEKAEEHLGSILDKQKEIEEKLKKTLEEKAKGKIETHLREKLQPLVDSIIEAVMYVSEKTGNRHSSFFSTLYNETFGEIHANRKTPRFTFDALATRKTMLQAVSKLNFFTSRVTSKIGNDKLSQEVLQETEGQVTKDTISQTLGQGFRQAFAGFEAVIRKDYQKILDKETGEDFERELGDKLVHDYKLIAKRSIISVIVDIANAMHKQSIMEGIESSLESYASIVPEALQDFFDIPGMACRVLDDIIWKTVTRFVEPSVDRRMGLETNTIIYTIK